MAGRAQLGAISEQAVAGLARLDLIVRGGRVAALVLLGDVLAQRPVGMHGEGMLEREHAFEPGHDRRLIA